MGPMAMCPPVSRTYESPSDALQIDESGGIDEAQLHHGDEAHAACENARVAVVLTEDGDCLPQRARRVVIERGGDHACALVFPGKASAARSAAATMFW